ncbi:MAG: hypothetical protein LUC89_02425 [Oscillospiraceae bacterium]|nr:hypothetical protein [Oscillospiraceae bacterium]
MKKILALVLTAAMMLSLGCFAFAAEDDIQTQGGWEYYINDDGGAVIVSAPDTVKSTMAVFIPGELGGAQVVQFGTGTQNVMSNNKNSGNYVLYPEGLETIAAISTYDFNDTVGWSIPASVTDVTAGSWSSCGGALYAFAGSAAAEVSGKTIIDAEENTVSFTISGGEGGYVTPEGTYYVPTAMTEGGFSVEIMIESAENYKIASVTVDGEITAYDTKTTSAKVTYDLSNLTDGSAVLVEFEPLAEGETEDRDFSEAETEQVIEILDGAVADGVELPDDVYYAGYTSTSDYENALGICTGDYYVYEGQLYIMIECNQDSTFTTKAEAINYYYETDGWVYGQDYDLIKLWVYGSSGSSSMGGGSGESSGEASGETSASGEASAESLAAKITLTAESLGFGGSSGFNACYLYKLVDTGDGSDSPINDYVQINGGTNEACLMAEGVGTYTVTEFTAWGSQHGAGPSECLNFFGNGSQIHVNGGTGEKLTTSDILEEGTTTRLVLNQTHVLGEANSVYATGQGQLVIEGGDYFSCESCGHGPYCSLGGQILINTDGTNLIDEDGVINITDPQVEEIPDYSLAGMEQDEEGNNYLTLNEHDDDVTVIVTGMDAGTCLATDSGGGVIVANKVVTKSYGLRSAGVYTIGSNESWVYLYNSTCTSMQDAGLCSASSGYAYAFNCRLQGPQGLKTRASTDSSTENSGLWVVNSRVSAYFDAEDFEDAYPVGSPDEMIEAYGEAAGIEAWDEDSETYVEYLTRADEALYQAIMVDGSISFDMSSTMVLFVDPANTDKYNSGSLLWWFVDRSLTPGHSGGNKFAVIYVTGSQAPISVDSTLLINDNYTYYGPESEWYLSLSEAEQAEYTPADNLLVSVENGGVANLTFTNENSSTCWDLTGESDETCELVGDFYLSVPCDGSEPGTTAGAVNEINATFINSEWTGCVKYADDTGVCALSFDATSSWTVTEETTIDSLTIEDGAVINATMTVDGVETEITAGAYEGVIVLTPLA